MIPGPGDVPNALTDARDIGIFTAKIIADPRTLNRSVLAYDEVLTYNQIYDLMEKLSGEKTVRNYVSAPPAPPPPKKKASPSYAYNNISWG